LKADFEKFENVELSGSMVSWGKEVEKILGKIETTEKTV